MAINVIPSVHILCRVLWCLISFPIISLCAIEKALMKYCHFYTSVYLILRLFRRLFPYVHRKLYSYSSNITLKYRNNSFRFANALNGLFNVMDQTIVLNA